MKLQVVPMQRELKRKFQTHDYPIHIFKFCQFPLNTYSLELTLSSLFPQTLSKYTLYIYTSQTLPCYSPPQKVCPSLSFPLEALLHVSRFNALSSAPCGTGLGFAV